MSHFLVRRPKPFTSNRHPDYGSSNEKKTSSRYTLRSDATSHPLPGNHESPALDSFPEIHEPDPDKMGRVISHIDAHEHRGWSEDMVRRKASKPAMRTFLVNMRGEDFAATVKDTKAALAPAVWRVIKEWNEEQDKRAEGADAEEGYQTGQTVGVEGSSGQIANDEGETQDAEGETQDEEGETGDADGEAGDAEGHTDDSVEEAEDAYDIKDSSGGSPSEPSTTGKTNDAETEDLAESTQNEKEEVHDAESNNDQDKAGQHITPGEASQGEDNVDAVQQELLQMLEAQMSPDSPAKVLSHSIDQTGQANQANDPSNIDEDGAVSKGGADSVLSGTLPARNPDTPSIMISEATDAGNAHASPDKHGDGSNQMEQARALPPGTMLVGGLAVPLRRALYTVDERLGAQTLNTLMLLRAKLICIKWQFIQDNHLAPVKAVAEDGRQTYDFSDDEDELKPNIWADFGMENLSPSSIEPQSHLIRHISTQMPVISELAQDLIRRLLRARAHVRSSVTANRTETGGQERIIAELEYDELCHELVDECLNDVVKDRSDRVERAKVRPHVSDMISFQLFRLFKKDGAQE